MKKIDLSGMYRDLQRAAKRHSPDILTGIGIAGMLTTTVFAVKATPKALILIEDKKREIKYDRIEEAKNLEHKVTDNSVPKLTVFEAIKATWKCYIPAAITGAVSIACLIGANSVNTRRNAALAAAYALSESTLSDYKDKVAETLGQKKAQEVKDAIAQEKIESNPVSTKEIVVTDKGESLCYDSISGRYFKSDIEYIRRSVNNLNERLLFDSYISLNDYYDEIGLDEINPLGDALGWTVDPESSNKGLIDLDFSSQLAEGTPCIVVGFSNPPRYDYEM